ncbi:MAG TPA: GDSL-type esterase/lipase family protein [Planctomycetota bacterium]|nr:GDSL-type esterase/lipase family protein [Planctomycetota bacterium]
MENALIPGLPAALVLAALACTTTTESTRKDSMKALDPKFRKILCIGDSITDGNTYPALLRQALAEAGYAPPVVVNAGIAGETSGQILARLDDDLKHKPTFITILAGANDMGQRRAPAEEYGKNMRAIAERIAKAGIPPMR